MKRVKVMVMQFEVYLDSLFLINFMMNLYILLLLNRSFMGVSGGGRMILGAALGAIGFLLLFLIPAGGVLRFGIGAAVGTFMMLHIAFPVKLVRRPAVSDRTGAFFSRKDRRSAVFWRIGAAIVSSVSKYPDGGQLQREVLYRHCDSEGGNREEELSGICRQRKSPL